MTSYTLSGLGRPSPPLTDPQRVYSDALTACVRLHQHASRIGDAGLTKRAEGAILRLLDGALSSPDEGFEEQHEKTLAGLAAVLMAGEVVKVGR